MLHMADTSFPKWSMTIIVKTSDHSCVNNRDTDTSAYPGEALNDDIQVSTSWRDEIKPW